MSIMPGSPFGSKITAEFVGVMLAKEFKYCLLIDDDVHLPANMPIVTDRISSSREHGSTVCVGYSIKSTGPDGSKGTFIQQAQDLEYKLSGLSRHSTGTYGSAIFPHGAIILWERELLEKLFWGHPGFKISEDWCFGHTCKVGQPPNIQIKAPLADRNTVCRISYPVLYAGFRANRDPFVVVLGTQIDARWIR